MWTHGTCIFGEFVWSLSGVLAASLLTALNILRNRRPEDKTLVRITLVDNLAWIGIVALFGQFDFDGWDTVSTIKIPLILNYTAKVKSRTNGCGLTGQWMAGVGSSVFYTITCSIK